MVQSGYLSEIKNIYTVKNKPIQYCCIMYTSFIGFSQSLYTSLKTTCTASMTKGKKTKLKSVVVEVEAGAFSTANQDRSSLIGSSAHAPKLMCVLDSFLEMRFMCVSHDRSEEMSTPRYFAEDTDSSMQL